MENSVCASRTPARNCPVVCLAMKPVGEPDAGDRPVRFDERGWETERCRMAQATAPILDSTDGSSLSQAIQNGSVRLQAVDTWQSALLVGGRARDARPQPDHWRVLPPSSATIRASTSGRVWSHHCPEASARESHSSARAHRPVLMRASRTRRTGSALTLWLWGGQATTLSEPRKKSCMRHGPGSGGSLAALARSQRQKDPTRAGGLASLISRP